MSVKSSIDLLCRSLPKEHTLISNIAYLESLITKEHAQPEVLRLELHDMFNQTQIKGQAIRFQREWFY